MPKTRSGYTFQVDGRWYARFDYTDDSGKRRNVKRRGENRTHAKELLKQLLREFEERGARSVENDRMIFAELAEHYRENYLKEAEYVDGRKVGGLRSVSSAKTFLNSLCEHFSNRRLRTITYGDIQRFRSIRLKTPIKRSEQQKKPIKRIELQAPTKRSEQRSIASVNRELTLLRRMMGIAEREGWIIKNPFDMGEPLINPADEKKRERILSREEEMRLLEACTGRTSHLRPILICALDTGMRHGEILKLIWADIDFTNGLITVRAFNTKTMRERQVAMTIRLEQELWKLYQTAQNKNALVFGIKDNVKRSFNTVRSTAKLPDVRFHDLRHTAATRLVAKHLPLSEVGRVLGHTQPTTTYRYVNSNVETAKRAALALDTFQAEIQTEKTEETKERIN
ncbi:MAG: site-specific integrase [Acidobacteria bacterium]|nr:site-specific integrase [Acidobacteriota bacterium]